LNASPIQNTAFDYAALNTSFNDVFNIDGIVNSDGFDLVLSSIPTRLFDLVFDVANNASSPTSMAIALVNTQPVNQFNIAGPGNPTIGQIVAGSLNIQAGPEPSADFNGDDDVDGADFLTWQRHVGTPMNATRAMGDADFNQAVDGADFALWKSQFGASAILSAVQAVPEPTSETIFGLVFLKLNYRRARRPT
jgi:hypothetical protein